MRVNPNETWKKSVKDLLLPLIVMVVMVNVSIHFDQPADSLSFKIFAHPSLVAHYLFGSLTWLSGAWFTMRITNLILWQWVIGRHTEVHIPQILKDIVAGLIMLFALAGIMSDVFGFSLTGFIATSGVFGLVMGFALRGMILDVLSGVAIQVEGPFKVGDYIQVGDDIAGQVQEINWRTTLILSPNKVMIITPNGQISSLPLRNYNRPVQAYCDEILITIDCDVPTYRAIRILTAAVKSSHMEIDATKPTVEIKDVVNNGIQYLCRYWVTSYPDTERVRTQVISAIMKQLFRAGISIVHEKRDIYINNMPNRNLSSHSNKEELISKIELFKIFSGEELKTIAEQSEFIFMDSGKILLRQGEEGDSLFIVVEGLLSVFYQKSQDTVSAHVGRIGAGQFLGEFSLLTGEKRSATVITETSCVLYELKKDHIAPLMEQRPDLAEKLSTILADRRFDLNRATNEVSGISIQEQKRLMSHRILDNLKRFFGL